MQIFQRGEYTLGRNRMHSKVVSLEYINGTIALIRMHDEVNKNTFTEKLIAGLIQSFEEAESNEQCKCIVLTGFGNYFATGGRQDDLLAIQEGKNSFLDAGIGEKNIYSLPLECKLPVISAMQGHAIGGGLAMGLFADFVFLSKESVYAASFMKYGFTPGFGSTCIFPEKLGLVLGEEFLMTARTYRGVQLEQRGIPFEVYARKMVLEKALELAELLAEKPRRSLILLKAHLTEQLRKKLPEMIQKELRMHDETFHLPEVKEKILNLYK